MTHRKKWQWLSRPRPKWWAGQKTRWKWFTEKKSIASKFRPAYRQKMIEVKIQNLIVGEKLSFVTVYWKSLLFCFVFPKKTWTRAIFKTIWQVFCWNCKHRVCFDFHPTSISRNFRTWRKLAIFARNSTWVPHFCFFNLIVAIQTHALTNFTGPSPSALKAFAKSTKNIWRGNTRTDPRLLTTSASFLSFWTISMNWIVWCFNGKPKHLRLTPRNGSRKKSPITSKNNWIKKNRSEYEIPSCCLIRIPLFFHFSFLKRSRSLPPEEFAYLTAKLKELDLVQRTDSQGSGRWVIAHTFEGWAGNLSLQKRKK